MHNLEINNKEELGKLIKKNREEFRYSQEVLAKIRVTSGFLDRM